MNGKHSDELVFNITKSAATPLRGVELASLNFLERSHLQEWVLQQPEIIGDDVLIITFEFDQWGVTSGSAPKDRLDVLGLGSDGRLVVAELKRGRVPDAVDLQSIKYAAMASRFSDDQIAALHSEFVSRFPDGEKLTSDEALEKINSHVPTGLTNELLLSPRIVILAEDFSVNVTSSVVWLNEQGVDITLKRYQAYSTGVGETILTVSQYYPIPEVSSFEVSPRLRRQNAKSAESLPGIPWTVEDFALLLSLNFEVPHAIMDLCSEKPDQWIGAHEVYSKAEVEQKSGMGKLAGFGYSVRKRFLRSNMPWQTDWARGGANQQYYCLDKTSSDQWKKVRGTLST